MLALEWFRIVETFIGPLAGAGLGAFLAFKLEEYQREKREHSRQISSLNNALFSLGQMLQELWNIKRQFIDPCRQDRLSYVTMRPSIDSHLSFDFDNLTFLGSKCPQCYDLLNELLVQKRRYDEFFDAWRHRSALHLNQLQPKFESAGFVDSGNYTEQKIENALGPALTANMKSITKEIVEWNSTTIESITKFSEKFATEMERLFPKEHFPRFEIMEQTKKEVTKPHPENWGNP